MPLIPSTEKPSLTPVDCAMFMAAFSRAEFYDDVALQESLISCFIDRLDEADGPTTVTLLNAHSAWCHHMIDTVLIQKKQPKRVYRVFIRYSDLVLAKVVKNLIHEAENINARGAIMMLINGRLWSHKKRDNLRMMKDFAVRAIETLVRERNSLGDQFD